MSLIYRYISRNKISIVMRKQAIELSYRLLLRRPKFNAGLINADPYIRHLKNERQFDKW